MSSHRSRVVLPLLLVTAGPAIAAVHTVGPDGTYASLEDAIWDATQTPEDDEVRVQAGTISESVVLGFSDFGGALEISGGWDSAFSVRDPDPAATVLDGGSAGPVLSFSNIVSAGSLALRGLTFTNGFAGTGSATGAGLDLVVEDVQATIEDCVFLQNSISTTLGAIGAFGGGAYIHARGAAEVDLTGVRFEDNDVLIDDSTGTATGAGAQLNASGTARIVLRHGVASGNTLDGGSQRRGAGLSLKPEDDATIEVEDFRIEGNHGDPGDAGEVLGNGLDMVPSDNGSVTARRLTLLDNWTGTGDASSQVYVVGLGGLARLTDSLVAGGGQGVRIASNTAAVEMSHLTITGHEDVGANLYAGSVGSGTLESSIVWDNAGGDLSLSGTTMTSANNLVGVDPLFVDAPGGDYRLAALSDAIDAGSATPTGGLGPFDLGHGPRTVGSLPDQGAFERDALWADGFERGDLRPWSATAP